MRAPDLSRPLPAPSRDSQDAGADAAWQLEPAKTESLRRIASRMARLGGWRVDLNPVRISWSPETAEIHEESPGVSPDAEQGLNYYAPEHQATIRRVFAECIETGKAFDEVLQLVTAKGRRIWVRSIGEGVRDETGAIVAIEGAFQDISQLVAMRDEANGLARRLRQTLESISDAFFLLDPDWRFSFLNGQAELLLGRKRDELEGKSIWEEFPHAVGSPFEAGYRLAVRDGTAVRFQEYFAPLEAWFDVDAHPTPEGLAVYFRDISGRKRADEDVRISNERFRIVAQATNDVIWDWDIVADTLWWNENSRTLFGCDPAAVKTPDAWVSRLHPDDAERVMDSVEAVINGTENAWVSEYRFLHSDGHALTIIDRGSVIRDESGRAIRMVGSMLDMTPQRELEGRLRQAQKLEAIGQLTGGIAHDFNNLLTVILGNAELLCDTLESGQQPRLLAEMISTAAQRGADLTSRLLAFGRKQPLKPRLLDLNGLLSGMQALLGRTLGEHIAIEMIQPQGLWLAEVDPAQLEAAILNLALNARDAMSDSGRLSIELANVTLHDSQPAAAGDVAPGQYVVLSVSDTGEGISPDVLARVFEPFFTTKAVGRGSGLGLSMVYGFVKQSGGHIRLQSEVGRGTSVSLYFPMSRKTGIAAPKPAPAPMVKGNGELVLVVEDDGLVRRHLARLLDELGYRVLEAAEGHEAIAMLAANDKIALLFTDMVMPGGMHGGELAKRALEMRPDIKVLFTSGYTEHAIAHHMELDPGIELIRKPYSRDRLASRLHRALQ